LTFRFLGHAYDVVFLFWRCVLHFNVLHFSLKKVSNLSDIAFLSIAVKNIVSLSPLGNLNFLTNLASNRKCDWRKCGYPHLGSTSSLVTRTVLLNVTKNTRKIVTTKEQRILKYHHSIPLPCIHKCRADPKNAPRLTTTTTSGPVPNYPLPQGCQIYFFRKGQTFKAKNVHKIAEKGQTLN